VGTRHVIFVIEQGEIKVAQYGQWDGDPDSTGREILNFLKSVKLEHFRENVQASSFYTREELEEIWEFQRKLPGTLPRHVSRDMGSDILWHLMKRPSKLRDERQFVTDGCLCEWAYVIDFDTSQFEVYEGFNTEKPCVGRFCDWPRIDTDDRQWTPATFVKSFHIDDLPDAEVFYRQVMEIANPEYLTEMDEDNELEKS